MKDSIEQAISQHLRNQKADGIRSLYLYSTLLLAINRQEGSYATTATPEKFWARWREQFADREEEARYRQEMERVAAALGRQVLGQVKEADFWAALPRLRQRCGDRAVLRAIHYFEENARALAQRDALRAKRFAAFAQLVLESGRASFALCQNVYCSTDVRHQGLSVALALSQSILQGSGGAWRMQGGGFAGTIQAYVPQERLARYRSEIERVFGPGSCYVLCLREHGAVRVI